MAILAKISAVPKKRIRVPRERGDLDDQFDTLELMDKTVARWPRELSSPGRSVTPYFIQLSFRDIDQPDKRKFFNRIPTSFSLTDEQVDRLIAAGRTLLRNNADYQQFVAGLGGARALGREQVVEKGTLRRLHAEHGCGVSFKILIASLHDPRASERTDVYPNPTSGRTDQDRPRDECLLPDCPAGGPGP